MTPTTPSAPDEVVLDEKGVVCPKCGGSGDFEEPNPFFDADDEDSIEDEFHKIACTACTGSGKMDVGPCPHCGSRDVFVERGDLSSAYVMCNDCACRGPVGGTEGDGMEDTPGGVEAIAAWNRRASPQPAGVTEEQDVPVEWREETRLRKQAAWLREQSIEGALFGTVTSLADDLMHYADVIEKLRARLPSPTDTRERVLEERNQTIIALHCREADLESALIDAIRWLRRRANASGGWRNDGPIWEFCHELEKRLPGLKATGDGSPVFGQRAIKPTEAPVEDGWVRVPKEEFGRLFATAHELTAYHIVTPETPDNELVHVCNGDLRKLDERVTAFALAASTKEE